MNLQMHKSVSKVICLCEVISIFFTFLLFCFTRWLQMYIDNQFDFFPVGSEVGGCNSVIVPKPTGVSKG